MAVSTRKRTETEAGGGGEVGAARFAREVFDELRKVVWPTAPELYRYTLVVVLTVVIISAFIGAVDYGVGQVVKKFVYAGVAGS